MRRVACVALVVTEEAVRSALVRVAEAALAFGPAVAFDVEQAVVWVEIGGCAHLHGGEHELARALDARIRALGHACRVAIADGPRIAAAVARFAPRGPGADHRDGKTPRRPGRQPLEGKSRPETMPLIVPEGRGACAVRILPLAALRLDDAVAAWLADLGLRTCGDLQKLPRRALGTRLGVRAHDVIPLLAGEDRAPLDVWRPPPIPEENIELDWGATSVEALAFAMKTLCDRLAARLEGRAMAAARIELVLTLDRALCEGRPSRSTLDIVIPSPVLRASDLRAIVRTRLEREVLTAPVVAATLRAPVLATAVSRSLDLLTPEPKAHRALPRLVAELAADLGIANVGTLELKDTWVPDERSHLLPFGAPRVTFHSVRHALVTSALEPSRLVNRVRVPSSSLFDVELLARIDGVEWWRRGASQHNLAAAWTALDPSGRCGNALAWVELASISERMGPRPHSGNERSQQPRNTDEEDAAVRGWID
jgi:protein ImuB